MEIRMMDAVPYPLNFAAMAFWKGILYNDEILNKVYDYIADLNIEDIDNTKNEMFEKGLNAHYKEGTILEAAKYLVDLAKTGLKEEEKKYIYPLEEMVLEGLNPYEVSKQKLDDGIKVALDWCVLKE